MRRTSPPARDPAYTDPAEDDGAGLDDDLSRRDRRTAWLAVGGVLVLLLALYGAAVAVAGDQIATGTRVGGVRIGGLAPAEATQRLREDLLPRVDDPVPVRVNGRETELDPTAAGLRVDVAATIDRAAGGDGLDPGTLWESFFGGGRVPPVVRVDQDRLIGALERLRDRTDRAPVEPRVTFDARARPVVRAAQAGSRLDVGQSAVAVLDAWLVDDGTVQLPVTPVRPEADRADLRRALRGTAETLVSAPVALRTPGPDRRLPPLRYARALSVEVVDGALVPTVDVETVARRLRGLLRSIQQPAVDARVELVRGRPRVVPASTGVRVEPAALADALLRAARDERPRRARVAGMVVRPEVSTSDARDLVSRRRADSSPTSDLARP